MDSKSYRVYNAETRRVRESPNVIFIETPSVMPPPDVGGYDDGEFTYDGHDDMVRDVRNYTQVILSIRSLLTMPLGTRP